MKKLPKGAEASNILVGELNVLKSPLAVFIRLNQAIYLADLTEVPVPTRFLFILLGPPVRSRSRLDNKPNKKRERKRSQSIVVC